MKALLFCLIIVSILSNYIGINIPKYVYQCIQLYINASCNTHQIIYDNASNYMYQCMNHKIRIWGQWNEGYKKTH